MKNSDSNPLTCKPKNERINDFKFMMNMNDVCW